MTYTVLKAPLNSNQPINQPTPERNLWNKWAGFTGWKLLLPNQQCQRSEKNI